MAPVFHTLTSEQYFKVVIGHGGANCFWVFIHKNVAYLTFTYFEAVM